MSVYFTRKKPSQPKSGSLGVTGGPKKKQIPGTLTKKLVDVWHWTDFASGRLVQDSAAGVVPEVMHQQVQLHLAATVILYGGWGGREGGGGSPKFSLKQARNKALIRAKSGLNQGFLGLPRPSPPAHDMCAFAWLHGWLGHQMGMAQNPKPVPPVNIARPTQKGSKLGGECTYPKMGSHWF